MRFSVSPDAAAGVEVVKAAIAETLVAIDRMNAGENVVYEDDFGDRILSTDAIDADPLLSRSLSLLIASEAVSLAFTDDESTLLTLGDLEWSSRNLRAIAADVAAVDRSTIELPHNATVAHIQSAVVRAAARTHRMTIEIAESPGAIKLRGSELLDSQQRAAVDASATVDLLVNAGAGSGKTHMLAMRIARLVAERAVGPDRCVVLTFSQAARDQIHERLNAFALAEYPDLVGIDTRTIHSLGRRIIHLASVTGKTRVRPGFQVVTDGRRRLADGKSVRAPLLFIEQYDRLFEGISDSMTERARLALYPKALDALRMGHPEMGVVARASALPTGGTVAVLDPRSGSLKELRSEHLKTVWTRYEQLLSAHNAIDFPGMVTEALEAVRMHPTLATVAAAPYEHIFVDEFQDTSRAQNDLLFELAAQGAVLSCVGDGDQTIYTFAGADAQSLSMFATRLRERTGRTATVMPLETNYRSVPPIVEAAESIIGRNAGRLSKTMRPQRIDAHAGTPLVAADGELRYAAPWLALQVRQLIDAGVEPRDIAVLFRKEGAGSPQESTVIQHLEKLAVAITTDPDDADGVRVVSIHQAKGSEFSHVLLLYLGKGHFPDDRGDSDEERRLLYVAVTRAKDSLVVAGDTGANPDLFAEYLDSQPDISRVSLSSLSDVLVLSTIDQDVLELTNLSGLDPNLLDWDEPEPES